MGRGESGGCLCMKNKEKREKLFRIIYKYTLLHCSGCYATDHISLTAGDVDSKLALCFCTLLVPGIETQTLRL